MSGQLFLCATPIGNLEDITFRVLNTLKEVDLIAAEDTRNSIKLLNYFNIKTHMISYHEFNKIEKAIYLINLMKEGKNVALITDAGTPAISDPGEDLVRMCYENDIKVTSLPGACACITALTLSGRSTRRFCFEAFLPMDKKERANILEELKTETRTIIIYEAPHKLKKTLKDLYDTLGDRKITLCKELTKKYEMAELTTLNNAIEFLKNEEPRGEFVILLEGISFQKLEKEKQDSFLNIDIEEHLKSYIEKGIEKKEAMKLVAKDRGITKREVYQQILNSKNS